MQKMILKYSDIPENVCLRCYPEQDFITFINRCSMGSVLAAMKPNPMALIPDRSKGHPPRCCFWALRDRPMMES
jgi:hypothetical protein